VCRLLSDCGLVPFSRVGFCYTPVVIDCRLIDLVFLLLVVVVFVCLFLLFVFLIYIYSSIVS